MGGHAPHHELDRPTGPTRSVSMTVRLVGTLQSGQKLGESLSVGVRTRALAGGSQCSLPVEARLPFLKSCRRTAPDHERLTTKNSHRAGSARPNRGGSSSNCASRIIVQNPSLEGLLLRLRKGYEHRRVIKGAAKAEVERVWPNYLKPPMQFQLSRRIGTNDLRRTAQYDHHLQRRLEILGLGTR